MSTTPIPAPVDDPKDREGAWIGYDLDGTIAVHDPENFDPLKVGEPVKRMVERAKREMAEGYELRILTARVAPTRRDPSNPNDDAEAIRKIIEDWTEKHLGKRLKVTHEKDYRMLWAYDDRIRQVIPNTGVTMAELVGWLRRALERYEQITMPPELDARLQKEEEL